MSRKLIKKDIVSLPDNMEQVRRYYIDDNMKYSRIFEKPRKQKERELPNSEDGGIFRC